MFCIQSIGRDRTHFPVVESVSQRLERSDVPLSHDAQDMLFKDLLTPATPRQDVSGRCRFQSKNFGESSLAVGDRFSHFLVGGWIEERDRLLSRSSLASNLGGGDVDVPK